ncbi:tat protein [Simian immunodeficiency virus]|uniref:Protein Tat n=1 Tax=Simian immunodeficiency virus TaxID=11723 RepID=Q699W4_SIV|nr:tat protein [Simian immunodeficiency virus]
MESIDPFEERANTPHPACMCKACILHCQLCFIQKGLGISYGPRRRKRKCRREYTPAAESNQPDQDFVPEHCVEDIPLCRPLPQRRRKCFDSQKKEAEVEETAGPGGQHCREDSSVSSGRISNNC